MLDSDDEGSSLDDPRVYFAAERTLLAWVRTGLAMMGFGFVVARFGLFLQEFAALQQETPNSNQQLSLWVGTAFVVLGVAVNLFAAAKHRLTLRRLERGERIRSSLFSLEMIVALLMALLGIFMVGYLLFGLQHVTHH